MVIKGSARGQSKRDCRNLANHLLSGEENETVEVVSIRGAVGGDDLHAAFAEWRAVSLGSRTRKSLYHASINVGRHETALMTAERWLESVDELEKRLGMEGHPRAIVRHRKRGREHTHVVWLRVDPMTLKVARDSHNYRTHELTSRELEERFGLDVVQGVHVRDKGVPRPVAAATHGDWQAAERTGVSVAEVSAAIRGAWGKSDCGRAFAAALLRRQLRLARGRRGLVAVDWQGTPHSIPRRLGMKAAEVRQKLADLDEEAFPTVEEVQAMLKGEKMENKTGIVIVGAEPTTTKVGDQNAAAAWWRAVGYDPVIKWDCLVIDLFGGTLFDFGDRMELQCHGEPTDKQIAEMVRAMKERGWETIRFWGDEDFQRRARAEAIRQGYHPDAITLDCEDGSAKPLTPPPDALPDHLKRSLGIPDGTPEPVEHGEHHGKETRHEHEAARPAP